jgi:transposase
MRERAIRLVVETKHEYDSEFVAISAISKKLGIKSPETLRRWVRQAEIDGGDGLVGRARSWRRSAS